MTMCSKGLRYWAAQYQTVNEEYTSALQRGKKELSPFFSCLFIRSVTCRAPLRPQEEAVSVKALQTVKCCTQEVLLDMTLLPLVPGPFFLLLCWVVSGSGWMTWGLTPAAKRHSFTHAFIQQLLRAVPS